jgi:O-antigen/teichoic acid export membrane protein
MTLSKQAASLAIMHAFDVLQPLIILPYAARVLGPYHFGQFAYAVSIGQFATTIVEYGFYWTAQRMAASARQEPTVIASLFADVFAAKVILLLMVTVAGLAVPDGVLGISKPMFLCVLLTAAGGILFPAWLFIGLERAWQAAVAVVVARSLALLCFLTMVTSPAQLIIAVAIQSAIPLFCGVISLPFVLTVGFDGFKSLTPGRVGLQLRNGWRGFLFSLVERVSLTLPVPLIGHFGGYVAAGQYSVAEKFVTVTRSFFRVMTETLLPRVAYYAHHNPEAGLSLIRRSLLTLGVGAALSLCLLFVAPYIIVIFFGDGFAAAVPIVRAMAIIPFLLNGNICMSNLYMFNYGHERAWFRLAVFGLLVFVIVAYLLLLHLANAAVAVVIAVVAKESVVFLVSTAFFLKLGTAKEQVSRAHGVAIVQATSKATGAMFPIPVSAVQPWRNQLSSDR